MTHRTKIVWTQEHLDALYKIKDAAETATYSPIFVCNLISFHSKATLEVISDLKLWIKTQIRFQQTLSKYLAQEHMDKGILTLADWQKDQMRLAWIDKMIQTLTTKLEKMEKQNEPQN